MDKRLSINVRLAGIDCPEGPHFGGKGQPFYLESKGCLEKLALGSQVSFKLLYLDQYHRAVRHRH